MSKKIEVKEEQPDSVKELIDKILSDEDIMSTLKDYLEVNDDDKC